MSEEVGINERIVQRVAGPKCNRPPALRAGNEGHERETFLTQDRFVEIQVQLFGRKRWLMGMGVETDWFIYIFILICLFIYCFREYVYNY